MSAIQEQPPPVRNANTGVWDLVIRDICNDAEVERAALTKSLAVRLIDDARERDAIGRQRYGMPLQAHNGRDPLVDAYQEALDLVVYLRQAIEEGADVRSAYLHAIHVAASVRHSIGKMGASSKSGRCDCPPPSGMCGVGPDRCSTCGLLVPGAQE